MGFRVWKININYRDVGKELKRGKGAGWLLGCRSIHRLTGLQGDGIRRRRVSEVLCGENP